MGGGDCYPFLQSFHDKTALKYLHITTYDIDIKEYINKLTQYNHDIFPYITKLYYYYNIVNKQTDFENIFTSSNLYNISEIFYNI
jgi:hypothetical protein